MKISTNYITAPPNMMKLSNNLDISPNMVIVSLPPTTKPEKELDLDEPIDMNTRKVQFIPKKV